MNVFIKQLKVHTDERGWLAEILRQEDIDVNKKFGQFYVTTAKPGITKANHYHKRKTEWFCVIKGKGKLVLKDIETNEVKELEMGDKNMIVVKIPPNMAHAIKNIGSNMMYLLAYIDEPFFAEDPDTYEYKLI
jgi:dTDP-4-dehydrorhamnose 3,5-epimerase